MSDPHAPGPGNSATPIDTDAIRRQHFEGLPGECFLCDHGPWPCDVVRLADALDEARVTCGQAIEWRNEQARRAERAEAELRALRAWADGAKVDIEGLLARAERAEAKRDLAEEEWRVAMRRAERAEAERDEAQTRLKSDFLAQRARAERAEAELADLQAWADHESDRADKAEAAIARVRAGLCSQQWECRHCARVRAVLDGDQ